jgi:hypothetical protein
LVRASRADEGSRWGTGDFGGSPIETRSPSREALATRDAPALARPIPRHDRSGAGFEPAFHGTKYPKSSPPASGRCLEDVRSRVAAGVPGERSSLVGPRAFVWSRSNETRHHPGPEPARFQLPGERSNLDGPEGPSVSNEGARFFTTRNYQPRERGVGFRGNGRVSLARRPSTFNEVTRPVTTRNTAPRIRSEFIF